MISVKELVRWAATLDPDSHVAIDDGGLAIVQVVDGKETNYYLELGGVPDSVWGDER